MIEGKSILAVIPARGGSKGVPRKNIRHLGGKPLIAWTIEESKKSKYIDRTIVSSEDTEIIQIAKEWGGDVPFIRPQNLAQDDTPGIAPVLHAIQEMPRYDYIMLLQATSPLRTAEDIDGCIEFLFANKQEACISVVEVEQNPYWMYFLDETKRMRAVMPISKKFYQRQKLPQVYILNGAIYIAKKEFVLEYKTFITEDTLAFEMPLDRSYDIDREVDFKYLEFILLNRTKKNISKNR